MKYKDMKEIVKLFQEEWDLGELESGAPKELCARIYLFDILEDSDYYVTYNEKGKLLGFCGFCNYNSNKHIIRKMFYSLIKKHLLRSKKIKDKKALKDYYEKYSYTPSNMIKDYDGEITMLILNKKNRGNGIGKSMLFKIFDIAKKDNMKNIIVLTDEDCSYYIYEVTGFKRIFDTIIKTKAYDNNSDIEEKAFIYKKELK